MSVGGNCDKTAVRVCPGNSTEELDTQPIEKSLPTPNPYPVRVFVNISYSVTCPEGSDCGRDFELQLFQHRKMGMGRTEVTDALTEKYLNNTIRRVSFVARQNDDRQFSLSIDM